MLVLAAVPAPLLARLERAGRPRFRFIQALDWSEALTCILTKPVELAVLDPGLEGVPNAQEIERLNVLFPSLPFILYTHLQASLASILLRLGRTGVGQVIIAQHDDHPARVMELLAGEAAHTVSDQLIAGLGDVLHGCPKELRWAIESGIREPGAIHSVQELADLARVDRRTCLRWFARANLPSPSVVLTVLRVVYAHRLLQDPGYTVEDVAVKLGYARARSLAENVKEVLGVTPGELRLTLSPSEALAAVHQRYFSGGDQRLAEVS